MWRFSLLSSDNKGNMTASSAALAITNAFANLSQVPDFKVDEIKEKAMAYNPPGVRVMIPTPSFSTNLDALGAYVGMGNGHQLRRYFFETLQVSNVEAHNIYQTFAVEKRQHFHMKRSYPIPS